MNKQPSKILYVDDEDSWRVVFSKATGDVFDVICANNAEEGWNLLQKHSNEIGVIVSDQRMPGRPGIELLKQARAYYPKIVRIITSGYADSTLAVKATNQGAVYHYIAKPWKTDELIAILRRASDYYQLVKERDNLLEKKLSSIQRKNLEAKVLALLTFSISNKGRVHNPLHACKTFLRSVSSDPGEITDVKHIFRTASSEMVTLTESLNMANQLRELVDEMPGSDSSATIDFRNVLLKVRDECTNVIYSIRNPSGSGLSSLSPTEHFMADQILSMANYWGTNHGEEGVLEISEVSDDSNRRGTDRFLIKIVNYGDSYPLAADPEDLVFNGINLDEKAEQRWLRFLFSAYHMGGFVKPIHVSKKRLVIETGSDADLGIKTVTPESVIAQLVEKFESWNYSVI